MTSERSSASRQARALRAGTALAIISIFFFGLGWLRAYAASRDTQRRTTPAAENPRSLPLPTNRPEVKLMSGARLRQRGLTASPCLPGNGLQLL